MGERITAACGLRPAEYVAVPWRDLDLERGEWVMQDVHDTGRIGG
jgi:integrase